MYNKDYCYLIDSNEKIIVLESDDQGKGECEFFSKTPIVMIKAKDKNSAIWALKDQKCAEAAFIEINASGLVLHIVEMKSKLTIRVFIHACKQIEGMYFASLGVISSLKLDLPVKVISYIAYKQLDNNLSKEMPSVLTKHLIGTPEMTTKEMSYWYQKEIKLKHTNCSLKTVERNENGDCSFGYIN